MIEIENLSYLYSKKKRLFKGLNLTLPAGKIYGLLGKNGAGKSSLLKNMAGLLFPSEGSCRVNGFIPRQRKTNFLEQLFFIPEECYLPPLSIHKFIQVYAPFYPHFSETLFFDYLTQFQVDLSRNLDALSFGQKKKAFISFALATNANVILMDEPTNGLDIPSKLQFRRIISSEFRPNQLLVISTHQVRDLDDLIDSVIILDEGEILFHARKEQITNKLLFATNLEIIDVQDILYAVQTPAGTITITKNHDEQPSYLDIEILFNAVLDKKHLIHQIVNANPLEV